MINYQSNKKNEDVMNVQEVFQMEGCRLIQFEIDNDHNVNDHEIKNADQSFYVIDSNQRVRRIVGCGDNS